MSGIRASQRFDVMSKRLGSRLREHAQETFPPDAQKGLRRFAMREAADLLRINQNTFRHHVSNLEGFPEGLLEGGNRRSFSAEDMVEAQRVLLETGRIKPDEHPHRRAGEPCQVVTIFNLKGGSALLRKSAEGRSIPSPRQTYPARFVIGVPRVVKRFRIAALI